MNVYLEVFDVCCVDPLQPYAPLSPKEKQLL